MAKRKLTPASQKALIAEIQEQRREGVQKSKVADNLSGKYKIGPQTVQYYMRKLEGAGGGARRGPGRPPGRGARRRGRPPGRVARRGPGRPPGRAGRRSVGVSPNVIMMDVRKAVIVLRRNGVEIPVASVVYSDEMRLRQAIREAVQQLSSTD